MNKKIESLHEIIIAIFRLNTEFLVQGDSLVEPLGLTSARWQILGAISLSKKPLTVPQIARYMGITRQGVQKQIDLLLKDNLCEAIENPDHARSKLHQITMKGQDVYSKTMALSNQWMERLGNGLDIEMLRTTLITLEKLQEVLSYSVFSKGQKNNEKTK